MTEEEYNMATSLLDGKKTEIDTGILGMTLIADIDEQNKLFRATRAYANGEDEKYLNELEYTADNKLSKETYYSYGSDSAYATVTTYYPDTGLEKTFEMYEAIVDEER